VLPTMDKWAKPLHNKPKPKPQALSTTFWFLYKRGHNSRDDH